MAQDNNLDLSKSTMIDPKNSDKSEEYAKALYELRKEKGMTEEQARELVQDEVHYGMMMIKLVVTNEKNLELYELEKVHVGENKFGYYLIFLPLIFIY